jgi:hypothetical protein
MEAHQNSSLLEVQQGHAMQQQLIYSPEYSVQQERELPLKRKTWFPGYRESRTGGVHGHACTMHNIEQSLNSCSNKNTLVEVEKVWRRYWTSRRWFLSRMGALGYSFLQLSSPPSHPAWRKACGWFRVGICAPHRSCVIGRLSPIIPSSDLATIQAFCRYNRAMHLNGRKPFSRLLC